MENIPNLIANSLPFLIIVILWVIIVVWIKRRSKISETKLTELLEQQLTVLREINETLKQLRESRR